MKKNNNFPFYKALEAFTQKPSKTENTKFFVNLKQCQYCT